MNLLQLQADIVTPSSSNYAQVLQKNICNNQPCTKTGQHSASSHKRIVNYLKKTYLTSKNNPFEIFTNLTIKNSDVQTQVEIQNQKERDQQTQIPRFGLKGLQQKITRISRVPLSKSFN